MDRDLGSVRRPTLTFVSRLGCGLTGISSCHLMLVRYSHGCAGVVFTLLATGCLFPEPPEWEAPQQTHPPQLMDPVPSPTDIVSVISTLVNPTGGAGNLHIVVNERSEDNGEGLRAILFLNYNSELNAEVKFQNIFEVAPGHLEELKSILMDWPIPLRTDVYCTPLTLIVTHESNVDKSANHFPILAKGKGAEDISSITWWIAVNPVSAIASCPIATGVTP